MTIIEYRASPTLPCDVPKMKRASLESLCIEQMQTIIDLQNELMAVKNVAHRLANRVGDKPRKVRLPQRYALMEPHDSRSGDCEMEEKTHGPWLLRHDVIAALRAAGVEVEQ